MPSDQELYRKFEATFKEHYNALANYAFSILKNEHDAEDVVQEVFIRVWQNSPQVIEGSQAKFYLLTAVRNGCISHIRKQAGKTFVQPEDVHLHHQAEEERKEPVEDLAAMANEALALLPPQCQLVFRLSRFGKLTYQQIADELGLSVKTVENQMGKALRMMRDYAKKHKIHIPVLVYWLLNFWDR